MFTPKDGRILLIDDDPLFGGMMCRKAEARGLTMDYSSSLVEAIYESYLDGYDLAIVDCMMPGIDGFEVSDYLSKFLHDVPVVLVSQSQAPFQKYMKDSSGAAAFVSKAQGPAAILGAVEDLLRRRAGRRLRHGNEADAS